MLHRFFPLKVILYTKVFTNGAFLKSERYPGQFPPQKTICKWRWSYPVIHVSRGEIRTCDKTINIQLTEEDFQKYGKDAFINNPYLMERRWEKLKGIKHSDCFTCIKLEERGIQSTRTGEEPFMKYMKEVAGREETFEEMSANVPQEILRADHPDTLEISLSNLCNLKCVYCSPTFSTAWEEEEIKNGRMLESERESKRFVAAPSMEKFFWEWFSSIQGSLKRIIFIGGEPLFNEKLYEYLDRMYEATELKDPHNKVWINIISNFSVPDKYFDRLLERIPKLTQKFNLHIEASGEAVGERLEYIREGLKWSTYTKNIEKLLALKQPGVYFGFQLAVNALCISSIKSLFEYAFELQEKYQCAVDFKQNVVVAPEYLSPYILTQDFAVKAQEIVDYVESTLANPDVNKAHFGYMPSFERWQELLPFLKSIHHGIVNTSRVDHLRREFAAFIKQNDMNRNKDFFKVFPEYADFFEVCRTTR
jgi:hypothetical protein